MSVFQRVLTQLANTYITQALARSKTFQKFAAATHKHVSHIEKKTVEKGEEIIQKQTGKVEDPSKIFAEKAGELGMSIGRNLSKVQESASKTAEKIKNFRI
eukprot:Nk52_evm49s226 gene=Nk52_evmTU49s226